jgi:hypothetical protein
MLAFFLMFSFTNRFCNYSNQFFQGAIFSSQLARCTITLICAIYVCVCVCCVARSITRLWGFSLDTQKSAGARPEMTFGRCWCVGYTYMMSQLSAFPFDFPGGSNWWLALWPRCQTYDFIFQDFCRKKKSSRVAAGPLVFACKVSLHACLVAAFFLFFLLSRIYLTATTWPENKRKIYFVM